MTTEPAPALHLSGASKRFGGAVALDDVEFVVEHGEVHGLVGENGSGKSTLVKLLTGFHAPDGPAQLRLWGQDVALPVRNPAGHGIAVIHQDLALVDSMSVVENLGITTGYGRGLLANVAWRERRREAAALIDEFGIGFDVDAMVGELGPADRAALAIIRALLQRSHHGSSQGLLILDEPTAYLSGSESRRVAGVIRSVAASGWSVVFVSHHLSEVLDLADVVTVLRDGRVVERRCTDGLDERALIRSMLGRELSEFYPQRPVRELGPVRLRAERLRGAVVADVSFAARGGEVVGVTGLAGMGQQELPSLLTGAQPVLGGIVEIDGAPLRPSPGGSIAQGVALVPGNRQRDGVWLEATATENLSLPVLGRYSRRGRLRLDDERGECAALMQRFTVRPAAPSMTVGSFSGGNQQKLVLAKWMQTDPGVLVLAEPTQGVDAGARHDILDLVVRHARDGAAVVICSTDLEQLANVCDRVLVLSRGRIVAELTGDHVTEDELLRHCHAGSAVTTVAAGSRSEM